MNCPYCGSDVELKYKITESHYVVECKNKKYCGVRFDLLEKDIKFTEFKEMVEKNGVF